jgi:hypothetical protein
MIGALKFMIVRTVQLCLFTSNLGKLFHYKQTFAIVGVYISHLDFTFTFADGSYSCQS